MDGESREDKKIMDETEKKSSYMRERGEGGKEEERMGRRQGGRQGGREGGREGGR